MLGHITQAPCVVITQSGVVHVHVLDAFEYVAFCAKQEHVMFIYVDMLGLHGMQIPVVCITSCVDIGQ